MFLVSYISRSLYFSLVIYIWREVPSKNYLRMDTFQVDPCPLVSKPASF